MRADIVVVGAGPAGSVAAWRLASAGLQVVILDRGTFPRDKPCGDAVSRRGLVVLDRMGLADWAARFPAPQTLHLVSPCGRVLEVRPPSYEEEKNGVCYGRMIPRRSLDERLVEAAIQAGAQLVDGARVRAIELHTSPSTAIVTANGYRVTAPLVILAEGSPATLGHRLGLVRGAAELVAVRQYLAGDGGPVERLEIHFQPDILPGYVWLFPVGDGYANVGIGTFARRTRRNGRMLPGCLARFITDQVTTGGRLAQAEPIGRLQGHPLRTQLRATVTHTDRLLVAGDAAGLVSPLSGEGIASAMESGDLAATWALSALEHGDLSAAALAGYSRALTKRYGPDHRAARFLRVALSTPVWLERIFRALSRDRELALLIGYIIIGHTSPRTALRPAVLWRLLRKSGCVR